MISHCKVTKKSAICFYTNCGFNYRFCGKSIFFWSVVYQVITPVAPIAAKMVANT